MKKNLRTLSCLLICILLFFVGTATVLAEEPELWNQKVYHISDVCDVIPEDIRKAENAENNQNIVSTEFDFAVMISGKDSIKEHEYTEYLDKIYEINDMGYGENRDGIIMGLDPDSQRLAIRLFGCGADIFSRADIDELVEQVQSGYQADGYLGAVRAYRLTAFEKVQAYRANPVPVVEKVPFVMLPVSLDAFERATAPIINDVQMPTWYASDPEAFVDFHND